jgi:hypothetical protein
MLEEARELLQAAEKESDPERKLAALEEALDLLEETPDSAVAANLKRSYARRLVTQLFGLKKTDVTTWFDYVRFMALRLEPELEVVLKENPELRQPYEEFLALWRVDALRILKPGGDPA